MEVVDHDEQVESNEHDEKGELITTPSVLANETVAQKEKSPSNELVDGNDTNQDDDDDDDDENEDEYNKAYDDQDEDDNSEEGQEPGGDDDDDEEEENDDNDDDNDDDDNDDDDEDGDDDDEEDNESLKTTDSRGGKDGNDGDNSRKSGSLGSHIPDYLDETTLHEIKKYLKDIDANAELDEDEIVSMMTKTDRNVENRARYTTDPFGDLVDADALKKEIHKEEEEYLVGHELIKEMQDELQGKRRKRGCPDKRTVNWVKRAAGLNRKDYHLPHSAIGGMVEAESDGNNGGHNKGVPRRYTRGMARSTRIKKKEEFLFKDTIGLKSLLHAIEELEPTNGPYPVPFECFKNKNRDRHNKHQHSGRKRPAPSRRGDDEDDDDDDAVDNADDDSITNKRSKRPSGPMLYPLVARLPEEDFNEGQMLDGYFFGDNRDILVVKIVVDGEHVDEEDADAHNIKERKRELKRLRDRQYQKRKRDKKSHEKKRGKQTSTDAKYLTSLRSNSKRRRDDDSDAEEEKEQERERRRLQRKESWGNRQFHVPSREIFRPRTGRGSVSLALLDWQRRQMWSPKSKRLQTEDERGVKEKVIIPSHLEKCGIGFRLPPWESVNPATNLANQSHRAEPPRGRHTDVLYAAWSHKLLNSLSGDARAWAIHEFFYSDIDRPWYNANPFAMDVAKLGILPTTKLTKLEWRVVRRMIPNRPRRFSRRFILSQLKERNEFRNTVREFQRNPDQTNQTAFAIPAPIKVGTTVTAYNKKFMILHRGTVLLHDSYSARYLVQFERKDLGYEFCSDTEVASHGSPQILVPPAPKIFSSASDESFGTFPAQIGELPYGTSHGPLPASSAKEKITCKSEVAVLLSNRKVEAAPEEPTDSDGLNQGIPGFLIEKVAERETLVTLMTIIDAAITRKTLLLDLLEKFNIRCVDCLPFGEGRSANLRLSGLLESHHAWLRANLEVTNRSLDIAHAYLQIMYGKSYSSTPPDVKLRNEQIKKLFIETFLSVQDRSSYGVSPTATVPWIEALNHESQDVGNYLATLVCQEHSGKIETTNGGSNNQSIPVNGNALKSTAKLGATEREGKSSLLDSGSRDDFFQGRMATAGGILSAISYCCARSTEGDISSADETRSLLDVVVASSLERLSQPNLSLGKLDNESQNIFSDRKTAEQELRDSLALLEKEFAALATIKAINRQ